MSKKKRIILHGYLAELYPHTIEVEAETVAEAVRSLQNIPELKPKNGQLHPVQIDGVETDIALFSVTTMDEIHVRPRTSGAGGGNGGLTQIIIGATLIAVAVFAPGLFPAAGMLTAGSIMLTGGMMVLGGILQMLYPVPEFGQNPDQESSRYLGAGRTTVKIGTRVPIVYGTAKLGGHYLSFDVDAKDQAGSSDDLLQTLNSMADGVFSVLNGQTTSSPGATYQVYDASPITPAVVNPIYSEPVASPTNIPTSGWIAP